MLVEAIESLSGHVSSAAYDPASIDASREQFVSNSPRLTSSDAVMEKAMDLIDQYEVSERNKSATRTFCFSLSFQFSRGHTSLRR